MKRKFTEIPSATSEFVLQKYLKRGWVELLIGAIIIFLLLIGNLLSVIWNEQLNREDIPNQPPQLLIFQRLLYRSLNPLSIRYEESEFFDDIFDSNDDPAEKNNENNLIITSTPVYTATIGKKYQYNLKISGGIGAIHFSLNQAPSGIKIDTFSGVLEWIPIAEDYGKQLVEVIAKNSRGQGNKQVFNVFVSKRFHPFGTDVRGRDILCCLILGTRWALLPGFLAVVTSTLLGLVFGAFAGYYGGRLDTALSFVVSLFNAFPSLILLFLAAAIFHFNIYPVMIVFGIVMFPKIALAVKNKVLSLKKLQFIEAAKELGLNDIQILWKDIIWYNSKPLVFTHISYGFALAILIEVTLSYLKLGIQIPIVSWGNMLLEGRARLGLNEFWSILFPTIAIIISVFGFYLFGDGLNRFYRLKGD